MTLGISDVWAGQAIARVTAEVKASAFPAHVTLCPSFSSTHKAAIRKCRAVAEEFGLLGGSLDERSLTRSLLKQVSSHETALTTSCFLGQG